MRNRSTHRLHKKHILQLASHINLLLDSLYTFDIAVCVYIVYIVLFSTTEPSKVIVAKRTTPGRVFRACLDPLHSLKFFTPLPASILLAPRAKAGVDFMFGCWLHSIWSREGFAIHGRIIILSANLSVAGVTRGAQLLPLRQIALRPAPLHSSDSTELWRSAPLRQLREWSCGVEQIRTGP